MPKINQSRISLLRGSGTGLRGKSRSRATSQAAKTRRLDWLETSCRATRAHGHDCQNRASKPQGDTMPRGDKSSYTGKQKRQAGHIEEGYASRGVGRRE